MSSVRFTRTSYKLPRFLGVLGLVLMTVQARAISLHLLRPQGGIGETVFNESSAGYQAGQLQTSVGVSYAGTLLRFLDDNTSKSLGGVLEGLVATDLFVGYGLLDRLGVEIAAPLFLTSRGLGLAGTPREAAFGLGDVALRLRYTLYESAPGASQFGLALVPFIQSPLVGAGKLLRSDGPSGGVLVGLDRWWGHAHYTNLTLGTRLRGREALQNLSVGSQLILGAAYYYRMGKLLGGSELMVHTDAGSPFSKSLQTPAELMAVLRSTPESSIYWATSAGMGLISGYGSPSYRFMLTLGMVRPPKVYPDLPREPLALPLSKKPPGPIRSAPPLPPSTPVEPPPAVLPIPTPTAVPQAELVLQILDPKGTAVSALITVRDAGFRLVEKAETQQMVLRLPPQTYVVEVVRSGYAPVQEEIALESSKTLRKTIVLEENDRLIPPIFEQPQSMPVPKPVAPTPPKLSVPVVKPKVAPKVAPRPKAAPKAAPKPKATPKPRATPKPKPTATPQPPRFAVGKRIFLPTPVVFQKGKASFEASSFKGMQYAIDTMKDHPEITKLNIRATVGDGNSAQDNEDLAYARADTVLEYFVNAGIEPRRLTSTGKVSTKKGIQSVDFIIEGMGNGK